MLKRIIFDLDDTLIPWQSKYNLAFAEALKEHQLNLDYSLVSELISTYYNYYSRTTINDMIEHIKRVYGAKVDEKFILTWLQKLGKMSSIDSTLIKTLEYLEKKYELVVLTNWFYESQFKRLQTAQIASYFIDVIGGDDYLKPNPLSFMMALGNNRSRDCLMVGDNYEIDIKPAQMLGLQTCLISSEKTNKCLTIPNVYALRRIL